MTEPKTDPIVDPASDPKTDPKTDPVDDPKADPKTEPTAQGFTQEDLEKAVQAAVAKFQKEQEEEARLAKLSEDDRKKEQLSTKEKELHNKEMLLAAGDLLSERSLPISFKSFLVGEDAETTKSNIAEFEKAWREAVENTVNDKLKGKTPKAGQGAVSVTKEAFDKMTYTERIKLYNESPELYKQLSEGE